jgi:hypothetical protein
LNGGESGTKLIKSRAAHLTRREQNTTKHHAPRVPAFIRLPIIIIIIVAITGRRERQAGDAIFPTGNSRSLFSLYGLRSQQHTATEAYFCTQPAQIDCFQEGNNARRDGICDDGTPVLACRMTHATCQQQSHLCENKICSNLSQGIPALTTQNKQTFTALFCRL